jgi:hypothetical protein
MHPSPLHFHGSLVHENILEPAGLAGKRNCRKLALVAARSKQMGYRDELQKLFQDFKSEAAIELHAGSAQQRADAARGSPLFSDDLSQVAGRNSQLQHRDLLACYLMDTYLVGQIDKSLRDIFN